MTSTTDDRGWLNQPVGLSTLFFTEMWERFSYYGMRALLVLFMVDAINDGGLGLDEKTAVAIYGLYTAAVYLATLPGGWMADRLLGAQKSIWYGGIIIMCGHFTLAIPAVWSFYVGLTLVALGTGLLKPNISTVVGELYSPEDARRDSGFTIFYMGINIGAAIGPLICSTLGESDSFGWHYGFAAAGVGMFFGLVQYRRSLNRLGEAGARPLVDTESPAGQAAVRSGWTKVGIGLVIVAALIAAALAGAIQINAVVLAEWSMLAIVAFAVAYFSWILTLGGLTTDEKKRVGVIIILFFAAAMFWAGFEQAGSSLNLFAENYTQRTFGGFEIPAGWFQSLNPTFIIVLAPVMAALWVELARRNLNPSTPAKFGIGLILLGGGFAVMIGASSLAVAGNTVLPTWLFFTYLLHTLGELTLSPVGLSATTRLAPRRYVGQMMGVWFLGAALGNVIAGLLAGRLSVEGASDLPGLYMQIVLTTAGIGLVMLVFTKPIRRLMGTADDTATNSTPQT